MDIKGWWSGIETPRKIMICAIVLLFVSQFFHYGDIDTRIAIGGYGAASLSNPMWGTHTETLTGWQGHAFKPLVFIVLAALFLTRLGQRPDERRWIYWGAVALFLVALAPQAAPLRAIGAAMGCVALIMAIGAAVVARKLPAGPGPS